MNHAPSIIDPRCYPKAIVGNLIFLLLAVLPAVAAPPKPVHLVAFTGDATEQNPPVAVIRIGYGTGAAIKPSAIKLTGGVAALQKTSLYHLFATKAGKREEVPIDRVRVSGVDEATGTASEVDLIPKAMLKADFKYQVELAPGALPLAPGFAHDDKKDALEIDPKELKAELDYLHMRTLENKAELSQGDQFGTGSLRYSYRFYRPKTAGSALFFVEAVGSADFDFASKNKQSYFDSLQAQLSTLWLNTWKVSDDFRGAYYLGFDGSMESDKDFNTVDSTVGAVFKAHVKNPITTALHNSILDWTSTRPDMPGRLLDAGIAPLFTFGYDYVGHVKQSEGTETGNQRIKAAFTWDLPLARRFTVLGLTPELDADFLIALEGVYDVEMDEVHDNSKLVLDIYQRTAKDDGFSFTVTYARGQMTPKYENVDALLAGFKLAF